MQINELNPEDDQIKQELVKTFCLEATESGLIGKLDKYQFQFLSGEWLEVFFWGLLRKHSDALAIWDVSLGITPKRISDSDPQEFDVSFMHNYSLCAMECKSGTQSHDKKTEILYKVEAVTKQFRASRVRSFLATTAPQVVDQQGNTKQHLKSRADIYGCTILTSNAIQKLADDFDNADTVKSILFEKRE